MTNEISIIVQQFRGTFALLLGAFSALKAKGIKGKINLVISKTEDKSKILFAPFEEIKRFSEAYFCDDEDLEIEISQTLNDEASYDLLIVEEKDDSFFSKLREGGAVCSFDRMFSWIVKEKAFVRSKNKKL